MARSFRHVSLSRPQFVRYGARTRSIVRKKLYIIKIYLFKNLSARCKWRASVTTETLNYITDAQEPQQQVRGRTKYPTCKNFKGRKSNSMMNLCGKKHQ